MNRIALFDKGFRPFFLVAAVFAAAWVPLWSWRFANGWSSEVWTGSNWHAHEMVFGFLVAVIAGFLLTAIENWTKERTVTPVQLGALVVLWSLGRVVMVVGESTVAVGVDALFLPVLTFFAGRPIMRTKNKRNYVVLLVLGVLSALNASSHAAMLTGHDAFGRQVLLAAVFLVTTLVLLIGGRIIPLFTRNAVGHVTTSIPWIEKLVLIGAAALVPIQFLPAHWAWDVWMVALGLACLVRMVNWQTPRAMRVPMLAILHVGHIWLAIGLITRGLAGFLPALSSNLGLHIITMGGVSTISLGMMARVARGHTGRSIEASPWTIVAFVLLTLAVVTRGVLPIFLTDVYLWLVVSSSVVWSFSFGIYAVAYFRVLLLPRADAGDLLAR